MTDILTQVEAAELEGLAVIDGDIESVLRVQTFRTLRAQKNEIAAKMDELKHEILADIDARHAQALTLEGQVVARKSEVTTPRVDSAGLKAAYPEIWARFQKITQSIRLTVID